MLELLLAAVNINDMWYALPLVVAISVVYAATRHEHLGAILLRSLRVASMLVMLMVVLFVLLVLLNRLT